MPTPVAWWWPEAEDLGPKIFNASSEAQGGDIISLQGANFDPDTSAILEGGPGSATALPIVNRVGTVQLSVQLPDPIVDPLIVRLKTKNGTSAPVRLNAARPLHLDATRLVPGGRFRVFGRTLVTPGHQTRVLVGGVPAAVDQNSSTPMVVVATLPADAKASSGAGVEVDNGNGTGPTRLEAPVLIEGAPGTDSLGLGVGWAAGFTFTAHIVRAAAACNGDSDDAEPIEAAIRQAAQDGGGVVLLPEGTCRLGRTVDLASRVILRGAGQDRTILRYDGNYPLFAEKLDLVGLQDLALLNAGAVQEGLKWHLNTRSFIQRVTLDMQKSRQWFLTDNTDFVFDANTVRQTASYDEQNPYRFDRCAGLVFTNNLSTNTSGSPTFQRVHDAVFMGNRFVRDASTQNESPVIAHHQFVVDFAYRTSILDNRFEIANGPVTNRQRNDGETILVEGGGPLHTEQVGHVGDATATTLSDPNRTINVDPFKTGLPPNMAVAIVSGRGMGQSRRITGYDSGTLRVDRDWDVIPDQSSRYSTFVWGLKDVLIAGNTLVGNPRGIWLYQASVKDVVIADNTIREGGGIYLRAFQSERQHEFSVQTDVLIEGNTLESTSGTWLPHIIIANVNADSAALGTSEIGIAIRRNHISANVPNRTSDTEEYASREGYAALVHVENPKRVLGPVPPMLGTIFQSNTCEHCDAAYTIGTGSFGAVFAGNVPPATTAAGFSDLTMMGNEFGGSTGTYKR